MPRFVTHYYLPSRGPFQNLSDLSDDEALDVMRELNRARRSGEHHRLFGRTYLRMRREAERRLREAFVAKGGRPVRTTPHYFVLGESAWFRGLGKEMAEVRLPLDALDAFTTSITYGDSFGTTGVSAEFGVADPPDDSGAAEVYVLEDLDRLLATFGYPSVAAPADYEGYERRVTGAQFIEVQVWSDEPVEAYLDAP